MSASAASTSKPVQSTSAAVEHTKDDDVPHLGVLEEDDEFEEFAVAGTSPSNFRMSMPPGARGGGASGHAVLTFVAYTNRVPV